MVWMQIAKVNGPHFVFKWLTEEEMEEQCEQIKIHVDMGRISPMNVVYCNGRHFWYYAVRNELKPETWLFSLEKGVYFVRLNQMSTMSWNGSPPTANLRHYNQTLRLVEFYEVILQQFDVFNVTI